MRLKPITFILSCLFLSPLALAAPKKGDALPPFSLDATSGGKVTQQVLKDTDLGIVYLFSTQNCPVCLSGIEQLRQIAAKHPGDSLRIIALGKQDLATLKKSLPVAGANLVVAAADADTLARYNAQYVLPTTYVTGPGGEILNALQGGGASTEAVLVTLAEKQLQRKKPAVAKDVFEAAEKAGGGSLAQAGKGYSLLKEGKADEAEKLFAALSKSADKETALRGREGLAEALLAKGQAGEALKEADAVLAVAPKRVAANLIRARALNQQGDAAKAEQSLAVATKEDADGDFSFQRAEANLAQGNLLRKKSPQIALASFKTAAKENPHSVEAISNLGALQTASGDPKQALETLKKAQALDPGDKLLHGLMRQAQEAMAQKQDLERQRYIDETVKDLAARFKEQQARKAQAPADDWTTPPLVVSVLGFREEGPVSLSGRIGLEGVLQHELQGALAAKGIQVVDRALLDKLLAELRLGSSDLADPDTQLKLGRILAARLTAAGSVRDAEGHGQASMRLIDTETTGIALSVSEKLAGSPDPAALAGKMAAEVAKAIHDKYPMKGRIALVDGDTVALNLGKKHGVAVGQQFNVLGKPEAVELNGKILGYKETKVAQLKVTEVQDGLAYAKAVEKAGALEKNQRVIQKD
ncbi:MAG TPA: tetratricopeptide repeat protein [Thiobacillaceae bacterium]|nr:tetratricopeptide repeat protein [Thiobacillaceae bacterium]HNH89384.1 tetratricopeptide repeat protein [Thiobacillaceae bacterium]HNI07164.1 tetratricopeptide repeat protein [Thiobacillaceae bacterium]